MARTPWTTSNRRPRATPDPAAEPWNDPPLAIVLPNVAKIAGRLRSTLLELAVRADRGDTDADAVIERARNLNDDLADAVDVLPASAEAVLARTQADQLAARLARLERTLSGRRRA